MTHLAHRYGWLDWAIKFPFLCKKSKKMEPRVEYNTISELEIARCNPYLPRTYPGYLLYDHNYAKPAKYAPKENVGKESIPPQDNGVKTDQAKVSEEEIKNEGKKLDEEKQNDQENDFTKKTLKKRVINNEGKISKDGETVNDGKVIKKRKIIRKKNKEQMKQGASDDNIVNKEAQVNRESQAIKAVQIQTGEKIFNAEAIKEAKFKKRKIFKKRKLNEEGNVIKKGEIIKKIKINEENLNKEEKINEVILNEELKVAEEVKVNKKLTVNEEDEKGISSEETLSSDEIIDESQFPKHDLDSSSLSQISTRVNKANSPTDKIAPTAQGTLSFEEASTIGQNVLELENTTLATTKNINSNDVFSHPNSPSQSIRRSRRQQAKLERESGASSQEEISESNSSFPPSDNSSIVLEDAESVSASNVSKRQKSKSYSLRNVSDKQSTKTQGQTFKKDNIQKVDKKEKDFLVEAGKSDLAVLNLDSGDVNSKLHSSSTQKVLPKVKKQSSDSKQKLSLKKRHKANDIVTIKKMKVRLPFLRARKQIHKSNVADDNAPKFISNKRKNFTQDSKIKNEKLDGHDLTNKTKEITNEKRKSKILKLPGKSPSLRKKSVSFSDDTVSIKLNDSSPKTKQIPSLELKGAAEQPVIVGSSPSKAFKKIPIRKDSQRSLLSSNEPPLFSQPDKMVKTDKMLKIKSEDNSTKSDISPNVNNEAKCSDPNIDKNSPQTNLLNESSNEKSDEQCVTIPDIQLETVSAMKKEIDESGNPDNTPSENIELIKDKKETSSISIFNVAVTKPILVDNSENKTNFMTNIMENKETSAEGTEICCDPKNTEMLSSDDTKENESTIPTVSQEQSPPISSDVKKNIAGKISISNIAKENSEISIQKQSKIIPSDVIEKVYTNSDTTDQKIQEKTKDTIPERKSNRVIKKKKFWGDIMESDDSESGKSRKKQKVAPSKKDEHSDSDELSDSSGEEEDDPMKLWCICRKPHNSRFMIQCDRCEDWFHGSCVGVTKQLGRQLEKLKKEWKCPDCVEKEESCPGKSKIILEQNAPVRQNVPKTSQKRLKFAGPSTKMDELTKKNSNNSKKNDSKQTKTEIVVKNANLLKKENNSPKKETLSKFAKLKSDNASNKQQGQLSSAEKPNQRTVFLKADDTKSPTLKMKVQKRQYCIHCQKEAMPDACYCSTECMEKHVEQCLKKMKEEKKAIQASEFESLKLVVCDRIKGTVVMGENRPTVKGVLSFIKSHPSYMIIYSSNSPVSSKKESQIKKESELSPCVESQAADESAKATIRFNVRKTLKNILIDRCKNADDLDIQENDVQRISVKIEEELHAFFKDNSVKYRSKYRSLMFNIKDPRNQGLFRKILKGNIPPDRLVRMSCEELASVELAKWREQENQHSIDMIKRVNLEHQKAGSGLWLKKTHKGEVEIEDDSTSIIEVNKDVSKSLPKDEVLEKKDDEEELEKEAVEKEIVNDTTTLHRSHLFDHNCKICTGKILPPPDEESISKKIRVAHSISVDAADLIEKNVSKIVEGKSPSSSTGDDSLDQEPTSTVMLDSPDIGANSIEDSTSKKLSLSSVWKGFIFMQDVAKFVTSAYKVSGHTDELHSDLPDTIQVCGRIIPDQVWDYLGKIKQSGSKELITIRFQAANEEESVAYHSFYKYLSSRKRYGVVSNYSKKIKDFYIVPLAATSPVPMVLMPFEGPGLPSPRPHLLLGVIVKHKLKQSISSSVPKTISVSKAESVASDASYTPPHEPPHSYTPPLPTELNLESKNTYDSVESLVRESQSEDNLSPVISIKKVSFKDLSPDEDGDKPYDPEQEIFLLNANEKRQESKKASSPEYLETHKKVLDALTKQVEETDRQVNAMENLISHNSEDGQLGAQTLDINAVASSGMSSFLDLPASLQEMFNTVRSKSNDKIKESEEKTDVDMRISKLFPEYSKDNKQSEISSTSQSREAGTPPPAGSENDSYSIPSDPRIKWRTAVQSLMSTTVHLPSSSTSENNSEPPPPGVDLNEVENEVSSILSHLPTLSFETTIPSFPAALHNPFPSPSQLSEKNSKYYQSDTDRELYKKGNGSNGNRSQKN